MIIRSFILTSSSFPERTNDLLLKKICRVEVTFAASALQDLLENAVTAPRRAEYCMKILSHACSVVEFCPACRPVQTMQGIRYEREQKGAADGRKPSSP
jgi:hypothetical protein